MTKKQSFKRLTAETFGILFPDITDPKSVFRTLEKLRSEKKFPVEKFDSVLGDFHIKAYMNGSAEVKARYRENPGAYTYTVIKNAINNHFGKKNKKTDKEAKGDIDTVITEDSYTDEFDSSFDDAMDFPVYINPFPNETLDVLKSILKPEQFEVVKLKVFEGYPYQDMVEIMEEKFKKSYSPENLRKIFERSMKTLRNQSGMRGLLQLIVNKEKINEIFDKLGIGHDDLGEMIQDFDEMTAYTKINTYEILCEVLLIKDELEEKLKHENHPRADFVFLTLAGFVLKKILNTEHVSPLWAKDKIELKSKRTERFKTEENRQKMADFLLWFGKYVDYVVIADLDKRMPEALRAATPNKKVMRVGRMLKNMEH